jgi:hypothetical protein
LESKGGAIAMITIRSIGQFSAENFNDAFSENYSLWQANIPLLLKLYEYQKQQSKQRYKCSFLFSDPLNASNT